MQKGVPCHCLALVTCLLIVGCAPRKPPTEPPRSPSPRATAPAKKDPSTLRIAVIPKSVSVEFWLTVEAGARAAAKDLGIPAEGILWKGPADETQITQQADLVQDMITKKVDAIVLAACDSKGLVPKVQAAVDAGIPVITIDSGVDSDLPLTFVATDNIKGAQEAARKLAELIGEEGEVGLIPFVPGAATSQMREKGFRDEIAKHPKIRLVKTLYSHSDVKKGMDPRRTCSPRIQT
jgi:ribose transport system substrate-binding protein